MLKSSILVCLEIASIKCPILVSDILEQLWEKLLIGYLEAGGSGQWLSNNGDFWKENILFKVKTEFFESVDLSKGFFNFCDTLISDTRTSRINKEFMLIKSKIRSQIECEDSDWCGITNNFRKETKIFISNNIRPNEKIWENEGIGMVN